MKILNKINFQKAKPVWEKNTETEMNRNLIFRTIIKKEPYSILRLTGYSRYSVFINGVFAAIGPARAGHGYYRIDELDITSYLNKDQNIISVIVAGYNCNSYYLIDMPSFFCAEVIQNNSITAWTSEKTNINQHGFEACVQTERVRKVQRYSFQRPFTEAYVYDKNYKRYQLDVSFKTNIAELKETDEKKFLPRGVYYPEYEKEDAKRIISTGKVIADKNIQKIPPRGTDGIGAKFKGFNKEDLEIFATCEVDKLCFNQVSDEIKSNKHISLSSDTFALYEMEKDLTGLIKMAVECITDTTVYILFDELLVNNQIDYTRLECANVVVYKLEAGTTYELITFEPYTFKYLNVITVGGDINLSNVGLIRIDFPKNQIQQRFAGNDEKLEKIYIAAVESFRQNTFDIYMDCASRERAGWLCDSFFISRVEYSLTGKSQIEHNFLSNFLMPQKFEFLPDGMLPMCYPADHYDGVFIPNWAMWYVLELEEYKERSGFIDLINDAKSRVFGLLEYFNKYENQDGLLENLESWVFVDWSKSNDYTQNINYPTNMLYARFKEAVGNLYNNNTLYEEAVRLKSLIRNKSKNGIFFCDNSIYDENGNLELSGFCSETCQYYAFFTGTATKETDKELWDILLNDFGPERKQHNKWPDIAFSNAFLGNYMRLELLYKYGYYEELINNIKGYFYFMAEKTGTLWEHDNDSASCNHGFASHVIYWLEKTGYTK